MQHDADSALMCLLSYQEEPDTASRFNENYHTLLLSEAYFKTNRSQKNHAELQASMQYFDSLMAVYPTNKEIAMLSARSHYMNGVGCYENDSMVEACKEYYNTLQIVEVHFGENELTGYKAKFMGLTYTRLGEVFVNYGIGPAAVDSYKTALYYFNKLPNYSLANTYRLVGQSYRLSNNNDSALYYYRIAVNKAKNENRLYVYSTSLSEVAPVYYDLSYKDSAFIAIRQSLLLQANEDMRLARYFTLGSLFAKECQYDSAIYYLEKSMKRNSFATQTVSAEILMNCYKSLGDTAMTSYYNNIYGSSFTQYRNNSATETELTKLFESYKQERLDKANLIIAKKHQRRNVWFLLLIVTAILCIFIIYRKNYNKDKALAQMKRKMEANPFIKEPICESILETVHTQQFKSKVGYEIYKDYALDKNQLLLLRDAVNRHYDNFTNLLSKKYPELTYDDIDYCCLYLLGLKDADVSALMQRAYPTVCERGRKLKRIFNSNDSLPEILKNIIDSKK